MDFDALARKLVDLDEEYQPVTICLYWKDYLMGRAEPFMDHGLPVVSAGHFYDQSFLKRFYEICACHEYAAGNSIGSHIFLSVASGCSYFHVDGIDYELTGNKKQLKGFKKDNDIVRRINDTFRNYPPTDRSRQIAEARYFLGAEYKRSRPGLIADLLRAEIADKLQIKGSRGRVARYLPRFWQRSLSRLTGKARRVLNQMRI
jgi:hypothetical protein